ncbi:MAG TPA: alpha-L-rhamnosidase C-terminal domain-containing protein [Prolixibacteraceae bacterium]|nr:alpha-L-rhamnosidase C-terminal domain-containing protein [Prolixibacteraceae bacterium]
MQKIVFFLLMVLLPGFSAPIAIGAENLKWTAHWIMHPTAEPESHAVILFRKSIELPSKPDQFVVHLSADNHYRLFVNGRYITRGPARGDIAHWFYETIDLAPYLQQGKNILAAEVVNWGAKRSFTYFSQLTSFIMQGDTDAEKMINTSGGTWKCHQNEAFSPKMVQWMTDRTTIDFGLYVGNPTDSVRAEKYPWGWQNLDYNDQHWLPAKWCDIAGGRDGQFAGGILYGGGKLLIPRRTGLLKETIVPFTSIRRMKGVEKDENFIHDKGSLTVPANTKVSLLIDQSYETMGYPEMIVSGGKEAHIQVMYAENMIVKNHAPKGNRNDIEGKRMVGLKDVFIPDGGKNRLFKPTYIRAFRYIQLDIETRDQPLLIEKYYHVACNADLERKAKFECGNPSIDWMMEAGWRTVLICAQDILHSDAAYEQMQYTGDSRVHNLTLLTLSGDDRLTRNALIQFDQSRIPEGLTYACYPNPFHLIIPSYSLIWIDQVHDYMLWKDDKEFIAQFDLGIYSVLDWYEKRLQPNGLLGKIDWWGALAWPRHYTNGEPPTVYEGNNTLYTLHYAYTLRHAADICAYLGKESRATEYREKADRICKAVNELCRNGEGFYTESPDNRQVSQITNLMAILAGATIGDDAKALMEKLLEPKDWFGQVDLFLHLYLFEAMNKTGARGQFMAELSEWQLMKERGMTTFAEVPLEWGEENQRSECHPWSTSPNYYFFRTVCGIQPTSAGHKTVEIAPSLGELTTIKAIYPHHLGNIEMDLVNKDSKVEGVVTIPQGMQATFVWGDQTISLKEGKQNIRLE